MIACLAEGADDLVVAATDAAGGIDYSRPAEMLTGAAVAALGFDVARMQPCGDPLQVI